jgi:hypothetical protein
MKLPPLALVAPSLCPRCDTPATVTDYCIACSLQLRQCGACQGIAGPFDRYCGFCGNELIFGRRRLLLRWLWLLVVLVPLVAGLGYGLSPLRLPGAGTVTRFVAQAKPTGAARTAEHTNQALGVRFQAPAEWTATDYTFPASMAVAARQQGDTGRAVDARGELAGVRPQAGLLVVSRPSLDSPDLDGSSPQAVLSFQLGPLLTQPGQGVKVEIDQAVRQTSIDGRAAAQVVLRITQNGAVYYLERVYVLIPQGSAPPVVRLEAMVPGAAWSSGDGEVVAAAARSLKPGPG